MAEITVNLTINGESDVKEIAKVLYESIQKHQPKEEQLKVGDYVIALSESNGIYGITNSEMNLAEIIQVISDEEIKVKVISHEEAIYIGFSPYVNPQYFRKATEEEVAAVKEKGEKLAKEKAELIRWSEIGRKPNEFKKGDAVRYKKAFTTVAGVTREQVIIEQGNGYKHEVKPEALTLVFPVEAKFE